jgi:hypothetical protein
MIVNVKYFDDAIPDDLALKCVTQVSNLQLASSDLRFYFPPYETMQLCRPTTHRELFDYEESVSQLTTC